MARINLEDSPVAAILAMAGGNPGAMNCLMEIFTKGTMINPDNPMGGMGTILMLDTLEIYGSNIYVLWSDICGRDTAKTIAVITAVQFGYFDGKLLKEACNRQDYSGREIIPVDELLKKVQEQFPNFG